MKVPPYMALYYDIEMLKVLSNQSSKHDDDEDEGVKVLPGKAFQEARKLFHELKAPDQVIPLVLIHKYEPCIHNILLSFPNLISV